MQLSDYEFELPERLIAQEARVPRDSCRLMVVDRSRDEVRHHVFRQLPEILRPGDCLVINETRVLPARLHGVIAGSAAQAEILLLRPGPDVLTWQALVRPGRRLRVGAVVELDRPLQEADGRAPEGAGGGVRAVIAGRTPDGKAMVRFEGVAPDGLRSYLWRRGEMPTPPYIKQALADPEHYQTVYSRVEGSVAAPTAGLHFTEGVLRSLAARDIGVAKIVLHVGYGTFAPLRSEQVEENRLDEEYFQVTPAAAAEINARRRSGGRIIPVGTSATRTLETVTTDDGVVKATDGWSGLFIFPGRRFRGVDCLMTNFHLPRSSPLLLTAAVAGWDLLLRAYREAVEWGYRFYSLGDGMLVL